MQDHRLGIESLVNISLDLVAGLFLALSPPCTLHLLTWLGAVVLHA